MQETRPFPSLDTLNRRIGQRIRVRRKDYRISAKRLGEALGISYQQIVKYETGQNAVSAARLAKIADLLQVPIGYFFTPPCQPQDPS